MGLTVYVYRDTLGDCTNGGISSKCDQLTLVNVEGPFQPTPEAPAALLDSHIPGLLRIVPSPVSATRHFSFGGNFAATSDSRFSEACERLSDQRFYGAVAIHDRTEA